MGYNLVRLKYTHEAMVDQMIANPCVTVKELAHTFGVTEPWIYRIRSSDAFRERLRARTTELVDPIVLADVEARFDMLANRSLEVLLEKLSRPADEIPDDLAVQAANLGAKAKGVGGFGAKSQPMYVARDPDWLEKSAERMRSLNLRQGAIDVQAVEIPNLPQAGEAGAA